MAVPVTVMNGMGTGTRADHGYIISRPITEMTHLLTLYSNISGHGDRGSIESGSTDVLSSLRC